MIATAQYTKGGGASWSGSPAGASAAPVTAIPVTGGAPVLVVPTAPSTGGVVTGIPVTGGAPIVGMPAAGGGRVGGPVPVVAGRSGSM